MHKKVQEAYLAFRIIAMIEIKCTNFCEIDLSFLYYRYTDIEMSYFSQYLLFVFISIDVYYMYGHMYVCIVYVNYYSYSVIFEKVQMEQG